MLDVDQPGENSGEGAPPPRPPEREREREREREGRKCVYQEGTTADSVKTVLINVVGLVIYFLFFHFSVVIMIFKI